MAGVFADEGLLRPIGKTDGSDTLREDDVVLQLEDGDVVGPRRAVVLRVDDVLGNLVEGFKKSIESKLPIFIESCMSGSCSYRDWMR